MYKLMNNVKGRAKSEDGGTRDCVYLSVTTRSTYPKKTKNINVPNYFLVQNNPKSN